MTRPATASSIESSPLLPLLLLLLRLLLLLLDELLVELPLDHRLGRFWPL
jgi:hypothetical protein